MMVRNAFCSASVTRLRGVGVSRVGADDSSRSHSRDPLELDAQQSWRSLLFSRCCRRVRCQRRLLVHPAVVAARAAQRRLEGEVGRLRGYVHVMVRLALGRLGRGRRGERSGGGMEWVGQRGQAWVSQFIAREVGAARGQGGRGGGRGPEGAREEDGQGGWD